MIGMEKFSKLPSYFVFHLNRSCMFCLRTLAAVLAPSTFNTFSPFLCERLFSPSFPGLQNPFILQFLDILFPLTFSASSSSSSPVLIFRSGSSFGTLPDRSVSVALFPATSVIPPSLLWFMTSPVSQGRSPYCSGVGPMRIELMVACPLSLTVSLMLFICTS